MSGEDDADGEFSSLLMTLSIRRYTDIPPDDAELKGYVTTFGKKLNIWADAKGLEIKNG